MCICTEYPAELKATIESNGKAIDNKQTNNSVVMKGGRVKKGAKAPKGGAEAPPLSGGSHGKPWPLVPILELM